MRGIERESVPPVGMIVIRRLVDRRRSYTSIMLPGEPARVFPTSDQEHARILKIYLQDRPYDGVHNDFSAHALGSNQSLTRRP